VKKLLILAILIKLYLCLQSCDPIGCIEIINRSADTILIYESQYYSIDSVEYDGITRLRLDTIGKVILFNEKGYHYMTLPDSIEKYCILGDVRGFFDYGVDSKGYYFIVKLEAVREYTWKEICKNNLYETLIITREMLKKIVLKVFLKVIIK